jgi:hypothetical protein
MNGPIVTQLDTHVGLHEALRRFYPLVRQRPVGNPVCGPQLDPRTAGNEGSAV